MKIGIIARLGIPVAKNSYGYYSRLHYLANGLVDRGHEVVVLGAPGSQIKGKLVSAKIKKINWETELATYLDFFKQYGDKLDIINCQTDHMCCFFAPLVKAGVVHTIIFGGFWDEVEEALHKVKYQYFMTISQGNKKRYPYLNWQDVIYNGIDIKRFKFNEYPKDYLLFLSRVCKDKGVEDAIKLARQTKSKLIIAGRPESEDYFQRAIKPCLNKNIEYFGIADFKEKIELFRNARALIHPHLAPEGFGNSIVESQACGTPVIAYPYGSTSEVIKNKKTGFIVNNYQEMKKAVKDIDKIDRKNCRRFVEDKFTLERMIDNYEKLFKKIAKKKKAI